MKTATHTLLTKRRDTKFWQWITLLQTLVFTTTIIYREFNPRPQRDILVVTPEDYRQSKLKSFEEADDLHRDQAKLATLFLLQRSPNNLDFPNRIKLLYSTRAYEKAIARLEGEREEFRIKSLHQKVELNETNILGIRDNSVLVSLTGQLIRTGDFEGRPFIEALNLNVTMTFVRNPAMIANGFYPTIVNDFEIETTPVISR